MTPDELVEMYDDQPDPPSIRGIADFDWGSVGHAYGCATDVPALLRALVSDDKDHRKFALDLLFGTIWHQGTVYEATAFAVPFLYRLLEDNETPNKSDIVCLIATLADGHSYVGVHDRTREQVNQAWHM